MAAAATVTTPIRGAADALARLAATRDPEAWAWLLEQLGPTLATIARRLSDDPASADDAVQEALLTLRDHAAGFRPRSDAEADRDAEARRWIMRVAANAASSLRRGRRRARTRDARVASPPETAGRESVGVEREETARIVRAALGGLAEAERAAIVLHVVGGLGYDQVAAELRCPVGTAKTRVHRGLERLRRHLGPRAGALSLAAVAATLSTTASAQEVLPLGMAELLVRAGARGAPPPPLIHGGITMTAKLGLVLAAALVVATPLALHAQAASAPITSAMKTKALARQLSLGVTRYLAAHPSFAGADPIAALSGRPGDPAFIDRAMVAVDGTVHDGFGQPFAIVAIEAAVAKASDAAHTDAVAITSSMGTPDDASDDWGLRFTLRDGAWREITGTNAAAGAVAATPDQPAPAPAATLLASAPPEARAKLAAPVTMDLADSPASEAATWFGALAGVKVTVAPALAATPITLTVADTPLVDALDQLARLAGGRCVWRDGGVVIAPVPRQQMGAPSQQTPSGKP